MKNINALFEKFALIITRFSGSTVAFLSALTIVLAWAITGPLFGYSENWQLIINTGTTIVTFLMVFLIQKAQNKDSIALHIKLNELLASAKAASNTIVSVEDMTEEEMKVLQKYYSRLAEMSKKEETIPQSHSIREAEENHQQKKTGGK